MSLGNRPGLAWVLAVAIAQGGLCALAFHEHLGNPGQRLLYAEYDGIKNYFTPSSFITDFARPADADAWKVYGQHYPFGEYLFYADATPAISLLGRGLARVGVPMAGRGTGFFTFVLVGMHWASAVVLFLLLRRWLRVRWLAACFALGLPWISKQYVHYLFGSFNLGIAVLTIGFVAFLWLIHRNPRAWGPWVCAGVWIGAASWFHLYYLIIYGTALAAFALPLLYAAWRAGAVAVASKAAAAGGLAIALIYVPILLIDEKLALRTGEVLGYEYHPWRVDVRSLITPYPGLRERYVVSYDTRFFGESYAYLGLWWWWSLTLLAVLASVRGWRGALAQSMRGFRQNPHVRFLAALAFAGTVCFFASLGTTYSLPGGEWRWEVVLNPFYFLVDHSVTLQHFRAIARFFYVTQWAWWLPVAFALDVVWRRGGWPRAIVGVAIVCLALDTRDVIRMTRKQHPASPLASEATTATAAALPSDVSEAYQGLLVVPFYHVGSQATGLVADPVTPQLQVAGFSLATSTGLPLVNAISSRTPPHEAAALFDFVAGEPPSDSLARLLDGRPILVAVHRDLAAAISGGELAGLSLAPEGPAREATLRSVGVPLRVGADSLTSVGDFEFYGWDWRAEQ